MTGQVCDSMLAIRSQTGRCNPVLQFRQSRRSHGADLRGPQKVRDYNEVTADLVETTHNPLIPLVSAVGIEPKTPRLKVSCQPLTGDNLTPALAA